MAKLLPVRGSQTTIANTPILDGQFLFETDQLEGCNHIYLDVSSQRIPVGIYNWNVIENKPFNTVGTGLTVDNDDLQINIQWLEVTNKPFVQIGSNLTVSLSGVLSADPQDWSIITNKPFESIGSGLSVVNNTLIANIPTQNWFDILNKPFETIGSGLNVVNNQLIADFSTINWSDITSKPFSTIGDGLSVSNNVLSANIKIVELNNRGTASASATHYQAFTVNSTDTTIRGTKYMEDTKTVSTSATTTFTFNNADITTDSQIDVYCTIYKLQATSITVTNGRCVVVFPTYTTSTSLTCRIYID